MWQGLHSMKPLTCPGWVSDKLRTLQLLLFLQKLQHSCFWPSPTEHFIFFQGSLKKKCWLENFLSLSLWEHMGKVKQSKLHITNRCLCKQQAAGVILEDTGRLCLKHFCIHGGFPLNARPSFKSRPVQDLALLPVLKSCRVPFLHICRHTAEVELGVGEVFEIKLFEWVWI